MVKTKGLAATRENWEAEIPRVPTKYKKGIERTTGFIEAAVAAEDLWAEQITKAAAERAREKGLRKITDTEWKDAARIKGAARIGPGMSAAKDKFAKGISRVLSTIEGVSLPPRTADPIANIDNRVKPIVEALVAMKKAE
ncbi:MAG: hypothetical protein ACXQTW_00285 [Candidatus Methanospirareceae archaeon]